MSRPWKVAPGTCITLPYLNSKRKIKGGGDKKNSALYLTNGTINVFLARIKFMQTHTFTIKPNRKEFTACSNSNVLILTLLKADFAIYRNSTRL